MYMLKSDCVRRLDKTPARRRDGAIDFDATPLEDVDLSELKTPRDKEDYLLALIQELVNVRDGTLLASREDKKIGRRLVAEILDELAVYNTLQKPPLSKRLLDPLDSIFPGNKPSGLGTHLFFAGYCAVLCMAIPVAAPAFGAICLVQCCAALAHLKIFSDYTREGHMISHLVGLAARYCVDGHWRRGLTEAERRYELAIQTLNDDPAKQTNARQKLVRASFGRLYELTQQLLEFRNRPGSY